MDTQDTSGFMVDGVTVRIESEQQLNRLRQNYAESIDLHPFKRSNEEFPVVMEGQFTEDGVFRVIGVFPESATQFDHTFDEFYEQFDTALEQFEE